MTNDGQLSSTDGKTSAQILEEINQQKRELRAAEKPAPSRDELIKKTVEELNQPKPAVDAAQSKANEATLPTPKDVTASGSKAEQAVGQSGGPAKADNQDRDPKEWAKKKWPNGITEESLLRSYRELENKFHKVNVQNKSESQPPQANAWQPTPQWTPPPQVPFPQYQQPHQPVVDRRKIIEEEAARLKMLPEDFEKVFEVANEVSFLTAQRVEAALRSEYDAKFQDVMKENRRNSELRELLSDPLFTNDEIQMEIHKVLEENPDAQRMEPMPLHYAFDEAQKRVARRYLQENRSAEKVSAPFPSRPPQEGGRGSAVSEPSAEESLREKFFGAKTADEKKQILTSIGARPTL